MKKNYKIKPLGTLTFSGKDLAGRDEKQWRKNRPLATGVLAYFPDALLEVAHTSWVGNEQHNKGEPLHWAREKSTDDLDALARHLLNHISGQIYDTDGVPHLAKICWRSLASLQKLLEQEKLDGKR